MKLQNNKAQVFTPCEPVKPSPAHDVVQLKSGQLINALSTCPINPNMLHEADEITGKISISNPSFNNIKFIFPGEIKVLEKFNDTVKQLLEFFNYHITLMLKEAEDDDGKIDPSKINYEFSIPLKEYMDVRELKNWTKTKDDVTNALIILDSVRFVTVERINGHYKSYDSIGISGGRATMTDDNQIFFRFSKEFIEIFGAYYSWPFPLGFFKGNNNKYRGAFSMAAKIWQHKTINRGQPNENIIGVQTLLNAAPSIPTFDEVMKGNRNTKKRIVERVERNLDLYADDFSWEFCQAHGEPLEPEQNENLHRKEVFLKLNVIIYWKNIPQVLPKRQNKGKNKGKSKNE